MIDLEKLKKEQNELAKKVILKDSFKEINTIAGVDQSFTDDKIISAIVVCDYNNLKIIEKKHVILDSKFPYIPEFLSYREAPAIIECYNLLENKPDILILDANGILHPRRIGLASHIGVLLDKPTIGVAKNLLCGMVKDDDIYINSELRGKRFITKENSKPIYISPGYKISLKTSLEVVKKCLRKPHKLPEPLHLAHKYVSKVRISIK